MAEKTVKNTKAAATKPAKAGSQNEAQHDILHSEIIDHPEDFFEKNKNILLSAAAGIALVAGGLFFYSQYRDGLNKEAQEQMFQAQYYFESDSLNKALKGDGNSLGFLQVADEYSSTKSGELAHFYAGYALLKQGKFQDAIEHLEQFDSGDLLVQARAYALTGDAHAELNQLDEAAKMYKKAAEYKPNKYFSPGYLMKLAMVQEAQKDFTGAAATYDKIIKEYYESAETPDARKWKARAEGLASAK